MEERKGKRQEQEEESRDDKRLPVREPMNANCGNDFCDEDSCPETGRKPPPHFTEATEQLLGDNSLYMVVT